MEYIQIENKYRELKQAFDAGQMDAETFQASVEALQTQDDYGRYWVIGAETGVWYYFDGVEWTQADPRDADALPFVDEHGTYWMLGKDTNEWYYFDGEQWQRPEADSPPATPAQAQPEADNTQYYQDDAGRYWAKGAKTGQWYFYDEQGWHQAEEAAPPMAAAPAAPQTPTQPTEGFQPIHPAPSYLQNQQPPAQPQQPVPGTFAQPAAQPAQPTPPPQAQPQQPTQPPADMQPETNVWYYFDGEQWLRYQAETEAEQRPSPAEEELEANVWYYFDGEQWLRYQDTEPPVAEDDEIIDDEAEEAWEEDEEAFDDTEAVIDIEDLEEYVEVVEIDEADIIDEGEALVDAEFEVEVLTVAEEKRAVTAPMHPILDDKPTVPEAPAIPKAAPTAERPAAAKAPAKPGSAKQPNFRGYPLWVWTSLGGIGTLVLAAIIIIGALFAFNNRSQAVAMLENQQTPTLPAAIPPTTPTPAPTPSVTSTPEPTATQLPTANYSSGYFGISFDYPAGWVFKEDDDLVIFAPSARSLDRTTVNGAALWISLSANQSITDMLANQLEKFSPISDTLDEGVLNIGRQTWTSAQVQFNAPDMGSDAIALIASTTQKDAGYTLVAVAPQAEWEAYKPLFEMVLNSFAFTGQSVAEAATNVPAAENTATSTPKATATVKTVAEPKIYTVKSGDTLGGIAAQFDISLADLLKANDLTEASILQIDQELIIPQPGVEVAAVTATATPTSKPKATATATLKATATKKATATPKATATANATPSGESIIYEVQAGDTLGGIAAQFGVSLADLLAANGLTEDSILQIGQELIIPAGGAPVATPNANATPSTAATPTPAPTATPAPATLSGRIIYPAFSPDQGIYNVWSMNADGSGQPTVIIGSASQPSISRDGSLLAYRSWDPSRRGIGFIDYAGGRQDLLTSNLEDVLPAWYNDGSVVFVTRRESDRAPRLYQAFQGGNGGSSLGFNGDYVDTLPDNRLITRGCTPEGDCGLWLLPPNAGSGTKISQFTSDTAPAANAQGTRIALMSKERDGANNWEIWTINTDGSDPVRITNNPAADGLPTWSPDGQSIAFVSNRNGVWSVWVANADGSSVQKLFDMQGSPDGIVKFDEQNSRGWLEERITWAP